MKLRGIGDVLFVVAIAIVAFVGGAIVVMSRSFPSAHLEDAYRAGEALLVQRRDFADPLQTNLWNPVRTQARGVTIHDRDRAQQGLTLYTSGHGAAALLVDMEGEILHQWERPYSTVWDETAAVQNPRPDEFIYFRKARLLADGGLLAIYIALGDTPWGYGMVRLDRDSGVVWRYLERTHHDFDITPDGRIYALTHEFVHSDVEGFWHIRKPWLDDFLVVLSEDGRELRRISIMRALLASPYAEILHMLPHFALGDPLHTNTVDYVTREQARSFPFLEEGQALLSFRELGAIAALDVEREEIVWLTTGPWVQQHDPSLVGDSRILLFDNRGHYEGGPENRSRIIEFDPSTHEIVWSYTGSRTQPFFSGIRSSVERLANGNTLITESDGGRLFEVTPEGEIVWELINPVRSGEGDAHIPVVAWGQRIDPRTLDRAFTEAIGSM